MTSYEFSLKFKIELAKRNYLVFQKSDMTIIKEKTGIYGKILLSLEEL